MALFKALGSQHISTSKQAFEGRRDSGTDVSPTHSLDRRLKKTQLGREVQKSAAFEMPIGCVECRSVRR